MATQPPPIQPGTPASRVAALTQYRQIVMQKLQAGFDPEGRTPEGLQAQLQEIDQEIARLAPGQAQGQGPAQQNIIQQVLGALGR